MKCSDCKTVSYCSKKCQTQHWTVHRSICRPYSPDEVWGIRILSNNGATKTGDPSQYFRHELIRDTKHAIFTQGERCPVTKRIGIPLIIYSTGVCEAHTTGLNEIAVKLRVEATDGFAPDMWLYKPGECLVIREDRKPLTRELLEAVYSFISHLMSYPILDQGWSSWHGLLNPSVWQMYAKKYYEDQENAGRPGFDYYFPPLN
ncbi:putative zf-MYND domain-containing protein [Lentinula aciculospora]|uniref:Zf-MYND domain-containing protein n=1 Tax=Lentinula aciculospora TaxID=153920 RepID=A0A9W9A353_9AGAR|nr:putative zf-MYND domain-containing protein [Lentinula aciculospora]